MKKQPYFGSIVLSILLGLFCIVNLLSGIFAPLASMPKLEIPMILLLSALAKVIQGCVQDSLKTGMADVLIGTAAFALLPWCAGLTGGVQAVKLCIIGGIVYGLAGFFLYGAAQRSSVTHVHKLALIINAVVLFLAFQSFSGVLL